MPAQNAMALRTALRRTLAAFLTLFPVRLSGVSILIYHSVSPEGPGFITDSPGGFEMHLRSLKRRGIRTVFASEVPVLLLDDAPGAVCITLDDGYRDNYEYAFPLLKKYGARATIFLSTGFMDGTRTSSAGITRPMLTREQVKEMLASGLVEFMPHTQTHPHLPALHIEAARSEIAESKNAVEQITGKPSTVFAYPYGEYTAQVKEVVRDLGFVSAFGVRPGISRAGSDLLDLPRNALGDVSESEFIVKTSDGLDTYLAIKRFL